MPATAPAIPLKPLAQIAPGGHCKLLMSFGAKDVFHFVCWLRLALYAHYDFSKTNHIYLDTYGLLDTAGTTLSLTMTNADGVVERGALSFEPKHGIIQAPRSQVWQTIDRLASAQGGSIGTMNPAWNTIYEQRMSEARAMMFIVTPAWLESPYCALEFWQFAQQHAQRGVPGIVVTFRDDNASRAMFESIVLRAVSGSRLPIADKLVFCSVERQWAVQGSRRLGLSANMRDLFTLTMNGFAELIMRMPNLRNAPEIKAAKRAARAAAGASG